MAKREYKTASGKRVDFDTLMIKGEETIAVGNMGVNARGDKLGEGGAVVQKREEIIADYYRIHNGTIPQDRPIPDGSPEPDQVDLQQTTGPEVTNINPSKDPILAELETESPSERDIVTSDELASALASTAEVVVPATDHAEQKTYENEVDKSSETETVVEEPVVEEKPRGGLASAVAKVKSTKPVVKEKTADETTKAKPGVKRV